jgi:prepilin-type N-terminal cleavage/methylation domain-containing protein
MVKYVMGGGNKSTRSGFTLVEVIVVLVILAILAAIAIPALTGYIDKARDKALISDARTIKVALQTILSEQYGEGNVIGPIGFGISLMDDYVYTGDPNESGCDGGDDIPGAEPTQEWEVAVTEISGYEFDYPRVYINGISVWKGPNHPNNKLEYFILHKNHKKVVYCANSENLPNIKEYTITDE